MRYDARWIIFVTPFIPVPGAECWLWVEFVRKARERGVVVEGEGRVFGEGVWRVSFYDGRGGGGVRWTGAERVGLIGAVQG